MGRAPKGTGINEIKGLDDDELDYNNDVGSEDAGGNPVQALKPSQDEKPRDSGKPSGEPHHPSGDDSARHPGGSHSDCKKSGVDPEVGLKVGHLVGPAAPFSL